MAGDLGTGVEAAEQALDEDPYDEESLRLVMAALAAQGRSSSALAMYERMRERLADELGTSPSELTDAAQLAILKGVPVPGIAVSAQRASPGPARAGPALPGRDDELRVLDEAFLRAQKGTPVTVVIEGEPGIGKTAVASAWIDRLEPQTVVLTARCDQLSRALPLQPVLHMIRNHLRRVGADTGRELLGGDATLLGQMLDWTSAETEPVADLTRAQASSPAGLAVVFAALRRLLRRVCSSPSVLFVDDVQRADALSWAWITDLVTSPDLPVLLLLTRRTGDGTRTAPGDTHRALAAVAGCGAPDRRRSASRPPARAQRRQRTLLTQLASSAESSAPPESIQAAVLERCAEAGAATRTLTSAAILGTSIDIDVLAAVLRMDPIRLLEDLDVGVRLGLLEARDGAYAFRHAVVREVLDASTASPRRALLHREAARVLSGLPGSDPLLVAHHARLSGARSIASSALTAASCIATDRFDYATALDLATELSMLTTPQTLASSAQSCSSALRGSGRRRPTQSVLSRYRLTRMHSRSQVPSHITAGISSALRHLARPSSSTRAKPVSACRGSSSAPARSMPSATSPLRTTSWIVQWPSAARIACARRHRCMHFSRCTWARRTLRSTRSSRARMPRSMSCPPSTRRCTPISRTGMRSGRVVARARRSPFSSERLRRVAAGV